MNEEWSRNAANAISHAAHMSMVAIQNAVAHYEAPSVIWKPRLYIDGNQWCALYGENLQDGVAGFGDSPALAMWDFDKNWHAKLPARAETQAAETAKGSVQQSEGSGSTPPFGTSGE